MATPIQRVAKDETDHLGPQGSSGGERPEPSMLLLKSHVIFHFLFRCQFGNATLYIFAQEAQCVAAIATGGLKVEGRPALHS